MNIKNELKVLHNIAKKTLNKKQIAKIKKVKDINERKTLFEHAIKRELELKIIDFRKKIKKLEIKKKDVFFVKIQVNLLTSKTMYFIINFHKKEFRKISRLIKKIKKDLKNA